MDCHYGVSLRSVIMKCHYGVSLRTVITECHYGVSLRSVVTECHYGVSIRSVIILSINILSIVMLIFFVYYDYHYAESCNALYHYAEWSNIKCLNIDGHYAEYLFIEHL
jgi:hypothetical protein